jgi:hypothetical protein
MAEREEPVEDRVEAEEVLETQEEQAQEAIRLPSPGRVEHSSSSAMESSMVRVAGPCRRGGLQEQLRAVSLVVGLEAGR